MIKVKILISFLILALIFGATAKDEKTKTASSDVTATVAVDSDDSTNSTADVEQKKTKLESKGSGKLPTSLGKTDEEPKEKSKAKKAEEDVNKPKISFNFLDAPLADISWCGTDKESMFILTEKGSLYRTTDAGDSWNLCNDHLIKEGLKEVDSKKKVDSLMNVKLIYSV